VSEAPRDAVAAFARYERIRARLPAATFAEAPEVAPDLGAVAGRWDGFVLDAFGVLNVGDSPIPGAVARMAALRRTGRRLIVLTNAASYPHAAAVAKFRRMGFDFAPEEVVSSRDVAAMHLAAIAPGAVWAALAAEGDRFGDLPAGVVSAIDQPEAFEHADGFLFLSTARWTPPLQARLAEALRHRPRPLVVANPDLVAPREGGLSVEPGFFAHDLIDAGLAPEVHWFGKPYASAFAVAAARAGLQTGRLAMVGDTLHTDILGGRAAGMGAVLVTGHGILKGCDPLPFIAASGIVPDVMVPTT